MSEKDYIEYLEARIDNLARKGYIDPSTPSANEMGYERSSMLVENAHWWVDRDGAINLHAPEAGYLPTVLIRRRARKYYLRYKELVHDISVDGFLVDNTNWITEGKVSVRPAEVKKEQKSSKVKSVLDLLGITEEVNNTESDASTQPTEVQETDSSSESETSIHAVPFDPNTDSDRVLYGGELTFQRDTEVSADVEEDDDSWGNYSDEEEWDEEDDDYDEDDSWGNYGDEEEWDEGSDEDSWGNYGDEEEWDEESDEEDDDSGGDYGDDDEDLSTSADTVRGVQENADKVTESKQNVAVNSQTGQDASLIARPPLESVSGVKKEDDLMGLLNSVANWVLRPLESRKEHND